ncbi:hypothetical protein C8J56DRAFT_733045, partial [Mycena floridula]
NIQQLVYNCYHMLRNDPRRQFVFGATCEDSKVRLWFFSRSQTLVTDIFDFVQNPEPLVRFLYAMSYATAEQLGYDQTMSLEMVDTIIQYDILVGEKRYCTLEVLSDFKADVISGRAARIWRVREINKDGVPFGDERALKDFWLEADSPSEKEIYDELKALVENSNSAADSAVFKDHFMEVIDGGRVQDSSGQDAFAKELTRADFHQVLSVVPDSTFGLQIPLTRNVHPGSVQPDTVGSLPTTVTLSVQTSVHQDFPMVFPKRFHQRTVFALVGTPYHELTNIPVILRIIHNITQALKLLWKHRRVHRDISSGNVYLDHNNLGKLSDFEFVKSMDATSRHEVRTGTAEFMSLEV